MDRPHFTVIREDGVNFDANHLAIVKLPGGKPALSFECSGQIQALPVEEIHSVEFKPSGATWCPWCDESGPVVVHKPAAPVESQSEGERPSGVGSSPREE